MPTEGMPMPPLPRALAAELRAAFGPEHDGPAWAAVALVRAALATDSPDAMRAIVALPLSIEQFGLIQPLVTVAMEAMMQMHVPLAETRAFAVGLADLWLAHRPAPVVL